MFSVVYSPNDDTCRTVLWNELAGVFSWWNLPWCIGGDFNVMRFPRERPGSGGSVRALDDFSYFIFEMGLMDIPLCGGCYSWSNNRRLNCGLGLIDFFLVLSEMCCISRLFSVGCHDYILIISFLFGEC